MWSRHLSPSAPSGSTRQTRLSRIRSTEGLSMTAAGSRALFWSCLYTKNPSFTAEPHPKNRKTFPPSPIKFLRHYFYRLLLPCINLSCMNTIILRLFQLSFSPPWWLPVSPSSWFLVFLRTVKSIKRMLCQDEETNGLLRMDDYNVLICLHTFVQIRLSAYVVG